jgi:hypothetical protein
MVDNRVLARDLTIQLSKLRFESFGLLNRNEYYSMVSEREMDLLQIQVEELLALFLPTS